MGFDWDPLTTQWNVEFAYLEAFYKEQGHANVPNRHITEDSFKLGMWVSYQRRNVDSLSNERIAKLDSFDFIWKVKST